MGMTRPIETDEDRNVWFFMDHFFVCLLVCHQSTRSIAFDFEGTLNQLRYTCYIYITPKLKSE